MNFKGNMKNFLIIISLMLGVASCGHEIEVTELKITSPTKDEQISSTPVTVEGIVTTTNDKAFLNHYTICLYKENDGGFYWQDNSGQVTIIKTQWQGQIWLKDEDFDPKEIKIDQKGQRFKPEGIKAIVCQKGGKNQTELPGYGNSKIKISEDDLYDYLQNQLPNIKGIKELFTINFKNMLPSKQSK